MFHGIKYLIVSLVFSHLGFWSGNLFLIAHFPDLCLLVSFSLMSEFAIACRLLFHLMAARWDNATRGCLAYTGVYTWSQAGLIQNMTSRSVK